MIIVNFMSLLSFIFFVLITIYTILFLTSTSTSTSTSLTYHTINILYNILSISLSIYLSLSIYRFSPMVQQFIGQPLDESCEQSISMYKTASPCTYPIHIPTLIVNGLEDKDVPPDSIETLYHILLKN